MYLHPEMPSYEEQLAARDRMLGKHPNLPFLGAHFGSLEWSVDALARFLEELPSAVVDTAARMGQLEYQSQGLYAEVPGPDPLRCRWWCSGPGSGCFSTHPNAKAMAIGLDLPGFPRGAVRA